MEVLEAKWLNLLVEEKGKLKKLLNEAMLDKEALLVALICKYCRQTRSGELWC